MIKQRFYYIFIIHIAGNNININPASWTVIQRRQDASTSFERDWTDYVSGFGSVSSNYWAGLSTIHALTTAQPMRLQIYIETDDCDPFILFYETFVVGDAASNYMLTIGGYEGPDFVTQDPLRLNNGMAFTSRDRDNDLFGDNCAVYLSGAWWYEGCGTTWINGEYPSDIKMFYIDRTDWNDVPLITYTEMRIQMIS